MGPEQATAGQPERYRGTWHIYEHNHQDQTVQHVFWLVGHTYNIHVCTEIVVGCNTYFPQVSGYIRQMEEMKEEGERRNRDLSSTRDSLSSATEECALLRKELEVRVQEIEATKRMASNVLR